LARLSGCGTFSPTTHSESFDAADAVTARRRPTGDGALRGTTIADDETTNAIRVVKCLESVASRSVG